MLKRIPIHYFWTASLVICLIGILMNKLLLILLGLFSFLLVCKRRIFIRNLFKRNIGKTATFKERILLDNNQEENLKFKSNLISFKETYYKKINLGIISSQFRDQNNLDIKTKLKSNQIKSALKYLLDRDKLFEKEQNEKVKLANIQAENSLKEISDLEIERLKIIIEAMYKSGKACRLSLEVLVRFFYLRSKLIIKNIKVTFPKKIFNFRSEEKINIKRKDQTKIYSSIYYKRPYDENRKTDPQIIKSEERLHKLEKEQELMKSQYRKIKEDFEKLMQNK
tara:strand:- start:2844 stop:3686 length:843 start_codon:yes stop_codon:yes gene_type:complete